MTRDELLAALKALVDTPYNPEEAHSTADSLLLDFINDDAIREAFDAIDKWYA
jgi:hypothetical protein